jgi:WD40 repeat protein
MSALAAAGARMEAAGAKGPLEVSVADELQPRDPDPIGPSRPLPLRFALAATLAVPGCRAVYAVAFGLGGAALAAADGNGSTYLWDMAGGLAATFAHPGSRGVIGVAFAPDDELLAAADANGRAYLWDLISGELARTFVSRRSGGLNGVAFGLGGDLLAAASGDGRV